MWNITKLSEFFLVKRFVAATGSIKSWDCQYRPIEKIEERMRYNDKKWKSKMKVARHVRKKGEGKKENKQIFKI